MNNRQVAAELVRLAAALMDSSEDSQATADSMRDELGRLDIQIQRAEDEGKPVARLKKKWRTMRRQLDSIYERHPEYLE